MAESTAESLKGSTALVELSLQIAIFNQSEKAEF
jgi:hypothetical protein